MLLPLLVAPSAQGVPAPEPEGRAPALSRPQSGLDLTEEESLSSRDCLGGNFTHPSARAPNLGIKHYGPLWAALLFCTCLGPPGGHLALARQTWD